MNNQATDLNTKMYEIISNKLNDRKSLEELEALIEQGADISADNYHCLSYAAGNGWSEAVDLFILHGADVNANAGLPLHAAAENGCEEVVRTLVKHGADIHIGGNEALDSAVRHGHIKIVVFLLESGADIDATRYSILEAPSSAGEVDMLKLLIDHGAIVDKDGNKPLHEAAGSGHVEATKILIEHGANPFYREDFDASEGGIIDGAMDAAMEYDELQVIDYLFSLPLYNAADLNNLITLSPHCDTDNSVIRALSDQRDYNKSQVIQAVA